MQEPSRTRSERTPLSLLDSLLAGKPGDQPTQLSDWMPPWHLALSSGPRIRPPGLPSTLEAASWDRALLSSPIRTPSDRSPFVLLILTCSPRSPWEQAGKQAGCNAGGKLWKPGGQRSG